MIILYNYSDFRAYIRDRWSEMPKEGYGQSLRMATFLKVHTTYVSQVMKGHRSLSMEQAAKVCEFFGLSEMESEYFLTLIELDKAGTQELRSILERRLRKTREQFTDLSKRLKASGFDEKAKAQFYSDWIYSAIRQMTALPAGQSPEGIADALNLPLIRVQEALSFLLAHGLCKEVDGRLAIGPTTTHVPQSSPWVISHHRNWRHKGAENIHRVDASQFYYTSPMTLSANDAMKIREMILQFLESIDPVIDASPSEELHCITIDWFTVASS